MEEAYCVKVTGPGPGQWPPLSLSEPEPEEPELCLSVWRITLPVSVSPASDQTLDDEAKHCILRLTSYFYPPPNESLAVDDVTEGL